MVDQTLILQEVKINDAQISALAKAIPFIRNACIQKLFIENCGLNGPQFASILTALAHHKSF